METILALLAIREGANNVLHDPWKVVDQTVKLYMIETQPHLCYVIVMVH